MFDRLHERLTWDEYKTVCLVYDFMSDLVADVEDGTVSSDVAKRAVILLERLGKIIDKLRLDNAEGA